MFPWWISWKLRWWTSIVYSLIILASLDLSSSFKATDEDLRTVEMFVDDNRVYKWDPLISNAFVLQQPFQTTNLKFPEKQGTPENKKSEHKRMETLIYRKNKINNKYQRVRNTLIPKNSLNYPDVNTTNGIQMLGDEPNDHYGSETYPDLDYRYPGGYVPSQNIIFPFKTPRDTDSRDVPSGTSKRQPGSTNRFTDRSDNENFHTRKPPPQIVSHVMRPSFSNRRSKGMGGSALMSPMVIPKQLFATEPAPQTAVVGSTAVLPCRVMGKVGHLQWTKDGFGMGTDRDLYGFSRYGMIGDDDEGDYSLRIQPVMLEDDALFQCQVSAIDGIPGIRSRPVRLTVYVPPDPPVIRPKVLETTAGTQSILECESIGGRPAPEIQWVDDSRRESIQMGSVVTSNLMDDGKRSIVRSQLTFVSRRYHNNNTITCLTSNQALSSPLTNSVILLVMFLPEVQLQSKPKILIEGDDVTFFCDGKANPSRVTYRWLVNDIVLKNRTSQTMKLEKISRSLHKNRITCEVTNKVGTSKRRGKIMVHYGPTFRFMPRDVMAEEGQDATLKCNVDSNPSPSIVWLKQGSNKIIGSGEAIVLRVNSSSAGIYKCIANVRGKDYNFPELVGRLSLLLKGPPQIVSEAEQLGRLGDTVSIVCSTVSVPSPITVTWTYNGREIDLNDPRYEMVEDEEKERYRNILVIHDSDSSDFGAYNCSVVNEYGMARKLITLQKEKRIPILLVVGCVVAVVIVAVVVTSLVFCNKRHTVKDTARLDEKEYTETNHDGLKSSNHIASQPPNEYMAKVPEESVPQQPKVNEPTGYHTSGNRSGNVSDSNLSYTLDRRRNGTKNETKPFRSSIHQSLSGEINHHIIQPYEYELKSPYEDDYRSKSQSQHNIHYPMDELGRRTMTNPSILNTHKYGSSTEPDYCTVRRGSNPYHRRTNGYLLGGSSNTPLLSNGSLNYCSPKRSPYNLSSPSSGSRGCHSQPPPYQKRILPQISNGRPVGGGRHSINPPITARSSEPKVKFSAGSKMVSGATYI